MPDQKLSMPDRARGILAFAACAWLFVGWLLFVALQALIFGSVDPAIGAERLAGYAPYIAIGFCAQLVDGTLGMGFGILSGGLLMLGGTAPRLSSGAAHFAEGFASAASAISHAWAGNVDWRLFVALTLPGIVGGVIGAVLISSTDVAVARPLVLGYLAVTGAILLWRSLRRVRPVRQPRFVQPLALAGGILDAAGGGGWGPVVAGSLFVQRLEPRVVVGTVDASEFFVTIAVAAVFVGFFGTTAITVATVGLAIGGVLAAPIGARLARRLPSRITAIAIALLLIGIALAGLAARMAE